MSNQTVTLKFNEGFELYWRSEVANAFFNAAKSFGLTPGFDCVDNMASNKDLEGSVAFTMDTTPEVIEQCVQRAKGPHNVRLDAQTQTYTFEA